MRIYFLLFLSLVLSKILHAQQPDTSTIKPVAPVPVEIFPETRGVYYQMVLSKHFTSESRFGFFNVIVFRGDYHNDPSKNEFFSLVTLTADVMKGLSIVGGATMVSVGGFRPTIGTQYSFIGKKIVFFTIGRVDLTETYNIETLGLFDFNPKQDKKWGPYMRIQGLFNYNPAMGAHARSALYFRLGLAYKNFQFGFGTNLDFYGPEKINENGYGGFLSVSLF